MSTGNDKQISAGIADATAVRATADPSQRHQSNPPASGRVASSHTEPTAVALAKVSKRFGGVCALADASISVRRGELMTLLGPSGCGKTTLLYLIAGFLAPDAVEDRRPSQLSGGQQQRVALARALVIRPKVLLLDEPFSALDKGLRSSMQLEIKDIQRKLGLTTIFVTHDQAEALSLSDRLVVMSQGCIRQVGTPEEIYRLPADRFVASFIGDVNVLRARLEAVDAWGTVSVGAA